MKKGILLLTLMTVFSFNSPAKPNVLPPTDPCHTMILQCPDGSQHIIVYCDVRDYWTWAELLCGVGLHNN